MTVPDLPPASTDEGAGEEAPPPQFWGAGEEPSPLAPPELGAGGEIVLAIDPGRAKCGVAVVAGPSNPRCLERAVVETERLTLAVAEILRRRAEVARLLLGGGTHSAPLRRALSGAFPQIPLLIVDEYGTSARARQRFLQAHPARGWRRLLPLGLRAPEIPYDDYAAILLAEDYFSKKMDI